MITAFHCTRLTERDIEDIRNNGLVPLTREHLENRINREAKAGSFSIEIRDILLMNHLANQNGIGRRNGIIYFFRHNERIEEDDCRYFLSYWGGEALSMEHTDNHEVTTILRNVGLPCVIEVSINKSDDEKNGCLKLYNAVPPEQIIDYHWMNDARFKEITSCQNWTYFNENKPELGWK